MIWLNIFLPLAHSGTITAVVTNLVALVTMISLLLLMWQPCSWGAMTTVLQYCDLSLCSAERKKKQTLLVYSPPTQRQSQSQVCCHGNPFHCLRVWCHILADMPWREFFGTVDWGRGGCRLCGDHHFCWGIVGAVLHAGGGHFAGHSLAARKGGLLKHGHVTREYGGE